MARNQPFEYSDDDDHPFASRDANVNDAEYSESGSYGMIEHPMDRSAMAEGGEHAATSGREAKQQTATETRSTTGRHEAQTSMNKKRGNQPR